MFELQGFITRVRVAGAYVTSGVRKMIELCGYELQGFK